MKLIFLPPLGRKLQLGGVFGADTMSPLGQSALSNPLAAAQRSDALKNFRASHPCLAAAWREVCREPSRDKRGRAHKSSRPDRGRSAICRPVPRRLKHDLRAANAPYHIVGNSLTAAGRTADENSREISRSRIDRQDLQQRASLTLPNGGEQPLRRSGSSGCEQKKQSRDDTKHRLLQAGGCLSSCSRGRGYRMRLDGMLHYSSCDRRRKLSGWAWLRQNRRE